jgi:hypothetical protein
MNESYKKEKNDILHQVEQLDKKAEMTMLSPQELDVKHYLKMWLMQLLSVTSLVFTVDIFLYSTVLNLVNFRE